jgi:hypothetical protein
MRLGKAPLGYRVGAGYVRCGLTWWVVGDPEWGEGMEE